MPTGDIMREQAVLTLPLRQWAAAEASSAVSELEQGKVLFLPELAFHKYASLPFLFGGDVHGHRIPCPLGCLSRHCGLFAL